MELVLANSVNTLVELDMGTSTESFGRFLDSQRELFHSQIDQLQRIVVTQCRLTGVNPLSQEMAAGALSVKIGKRPRDLLNPKAIKYMQSVFSIKDTISKKETREISALCGVTISQVREFFAGQRSRVRKLVRLSREKAIRSTTCKASSNECSTSSDPALPDSKQAPMDIKTVGECTQVPPNSGHLCTVQEGKQAPVDSMDPKNVEEGPSCSLQEETIPGVDSDDKIFVENINNLMRKEETFSGQVKLMEWILQIDNSVILHWFLTKGGLMILATWLSQAALEEQTTVIFVIFKVLCHLPLHKALPVQMSAILQTVNRLRFYRTSDISNKARVLLARWSKLFVRSQALKRPFSVNSASDVQKEIIRKQRISEILSDESWQSIPEDILALGSEGSESSRKLEPRRALKLLPSSCDVSNKKLVQNVLSLKTKERRKILLVEQPDSKTAGRNAPISRAVPVNRSRPMSADDIQKAKMRAIFMQDKYGRIDASANDDYSQKTNDKKISDFQTSSILPTSKLPQLKKDEDKKIVVPSTETTNTVLETLIDSKPSSTSQELLWEKLKSDRIPWQTPPEMRIDCLWSLGAGQNSKEVEVQTGRIQRERETFYLNVHDIPSNPKEPWDLEMGYDDSLTPEIPTEQPPDAEGAGGAGDVDSAEVSLVSSCDKIDNAEPVPCTTSAAPPISNAAPEPDLELLAVLLKNPDLVFALTAGQGNSLSSAETVALLDMLKKSGVESTGILNGLGGNSREKSEPTSLPSPTPPSDSDPTRTGWRLDKTPLLQQPRMRESKEATDSPTVNPPNPFPVRILSSGKIPGPSLVSPQDPTTLFSMPQLTVTVNPPSSQHHNNPVIHFPPNKALPLPHQVSTSTSPFQQIQNPEPILPTRHFPAASVPTASSSLWHETINFDRIPNQNALHSWAVPPIHPTPPRPQPSLISEPRAPPAPIPRWPGVGAGSMRQDPVPNSWNNRPNGLLGVPSLNPHFPANQNNYNPFSAGPMFPGLMVERNGILDGSGLESWSPERSPLMSLEFRSIQNLPESRREHGRNNRPEQRYRQHNAGFRDRPRSGRRYRDRDRRR